MIGNTASALWPLIPKIEQALVQPLAGDALKKLVRSAFDADTLQAVPQFGQRETGGHVHP